MKGKVGYALILGSILLASGYSLVKADSNNTTGGTVNDPLVTKSYVDNLLKGGTQATQQPATSSTQPSPSPAAAPGINVVQLQNGQILYASAGTELLVRSGKTITVSIDENGIPDATAGKDLPPGTAVDSNHLLIFPREGRGVKSAPKNTQDIYIMVRGSYTIMNEDGSKVAQ